MQKSIFVLLLGFSTALALAADTKLSYPTGFRDWNHVKSMVINQGHPLFEMVGGIHHIYANQKALQGYRAGNKFADGSVIVFDLFTAVNADNAISEGAHKAVIVMQHDSHKFAATDGWGYEVFDPNTKKGTLDAKAAQDCHACHQAKQDSGFVFSTLRD
jgi:hypothetical protein